LLRGFGAAKWSNKRQTYANFPKKNILHSKIMPLSPLTMDQLEQVFCCPRVVGNPVRPHGFVGFKNEVLPYCPGEALRQLVLLGSQEVFGG